MISACIFRVAGHSAVVVDVVDVVEPVVVLPVVVVVVVVVVAHVTDVNVIVDGIFRQRPKS